MERLGTPDRKGILAFFKPMSPEDVQKKREQEAKEQEAAREDVQKKMLDDARSLLKEMSKTPAASSSKKAKAEPKKSMKKK